MWTQAWPTLQIDQLNRSLADLETLVRSSEPFDPASVQLSKFLVVRTCGYLEQVVEICCQSYLKSKSDPRSSSFGSSWFGRGTNPWPDALVTLVGRFDQEWADQLSCLMDQDDELLKRELAYLVDRRNKISHGLSEGVGMRKALDLVPRARVVSGWFVDKFDPR